jgi:hypothetical protein
VTVPLPARFDGTADAASDRHPSRLKGGRPAVTLTGLTAAEIPGDPAVESWEGVLVELVNVETTDACYPSPYDPSTGDPFLRDFGYFLVTGDAEIGTSFRMDKSFSGYFLNAVVNGDQNKTCENAGTETDNPSTMKCEDSRSLGQAFTSLTGIVNFSFDVYRVNPRTEADIAPSSLFVADDSGACQ